MSDLLFYITILTLAFSLFRFWSNYRFKAIAHPGFIFSILWLASVPSYKLLSSFNDIFKPVNPEMVDELHFFVLFTTICFILIGGYKRNAVLKSVPFWNVDLFRRYYKTIAVIAFLGILIIWITLNATMNIGSNRIEAIRSFNSSTDFGGQYSPIFAFGSILNSLMLPCTLFAGYSLSLWMRGDKLLFRGRIWYLLPLISYFMYAASTGGRNPLIWGVKYYILGFGLGCGIYVVRLRARKLFFSSILLFLLINLYSTFVANDRARSQGYTIETNENWSKLGPLSSFSGIVEYLSFHYMGYQFRRVDYVDKQLTLGAKTFSGVLNISIPFGSTLGIRGNIGSLFGIEDIYDIKDIMFKSNLPWSYTTSTSYMILYDDFGFIGTLIVIFIFVVITQNLYINWFSRKHKYFVSIYPLFIFWAFWSNTIFDPFFTGNLMGPLYFFLIVDLILRFYKNNQLRKTVTA